VSILPGSLGPINGGRLRGGILSAAQPLPAAYDSWRQGVSFNSTCVDTENPRLWYCVDPTPVPGDKVADSVGTPVVFEPFMVYSERDCSTWISPSELEELARIGLDRTLSQGVALQLQTNAVGSSSPSLNSVAIDITPVSGPVDVTNTLSGLIGNATCTCGLTEIIVHAPLRSLPFFVERELVEWDEARGLWHMGPYAFSFDCYSEVGPDDVETDADGSEAWLYVTGPVEWSIGEAEVVGRPHSIVPRTNEALSLIEHLSIVRFDTCCVYAARTELF